MGMWVLVIVARPLTRATQGLVALLLVAFAVLVATPDLREPLALELPRPVVCMAVIGVVAVAGALMELGARLPLLLKRDAER
jgi:cation-transporting ATPase E